jgi:hypothetical protein
MPKTIPFVQVEGVPPPEGVKVVVSTTVSGLFVKSMKGPVPVLVTRTLSPMCKKWLCAEMAVLFV